MLDPNVIIPEAQARFVRDVTSWTSGELFGINEDTKPFSHVFADMLALISLADPLLPVAQQQDFLSNLQSQN